MAPVPTELAQRPGVLTRLHQGGVALASSNVPRVKVSVTYKGKPAVVHLLGRTLTASSPKGFTQHFVEVLGAGSPSLSFDGTTLKWRGYHMEVAPERAAMAARLVEAVDATRTGDPLPPSPVTHPPRRESDDARAFRVASRVEAFALLVLVLGVIGGAIVAFMTDESCSGSYSCKTTHPYVGLGIGLAVATALQASVVIMLAVYIQARSARAMG